MKKTIIEDGVVHEVVYVTSFPSPKNLCKVKGQYTHDYEFRADGEGKKYKVCVRCGNLPLSS